MKKQIIAIFSAIVLVSSCTIIRPGEVGVKQKLGRLSEKINTGGVVYYNPFIAKVIRLSVQTNSLELAISLPSKEGLSINSQISILYRLNKEQVPFVIKNLGLQYGEIIANIFRSASSDICAQYYAKDLHSGKRAEIEKAIKDKMMTILTNQGVQIDTVLIKSIQLPVGLANSIEQKLQAEQDVMRMEFVLKQAKLEAERKVIEAQGTSDAQKIISQGLTNEIIKIRSIEAFIELSKSPNSKTIIIDGKTPFLINND
jgi:regulator of protease activity HflC (stomatin/prohibitin superfamily)